MVKISYFFGLNNQNNILINIIPLNLVSTIDNSYLLEDLLNLCFRWLFLKNILLIYGHI